MLPRRSHTKSRLGCLECKRRKIKCDEEKPACIQCSRRHVQCEYASNAPITRRSRRREASSTSTAQSRRSVTGEIQPSSTVSEPAHHGGELQTKQDSGLGSDEGARLDKLDLEIFYTLLTSLPPEMKSTPESQSPNFWTKVLPGLAFKHDFILHFALALAAQFMLRQGRAENAIRLRASEHYQLALPLFIQRVADVQEDVNVLWIGSLLMCLHSFACEPRPGEYLMFNDTEDPEWYVLFRGARKVWELSSSSLSPGERPTPSSYDTSPRPTVDTPGDGNSSKGDDRALFFDWLRRFQDLLTTLTVEDSSYSKYSQALDELELSYVEQYGPPDGYGKTVKVVTHSAFAWLYRLSDEFVAALQEKKSIALVIFAFYMPILYNGQPCWLTRHWCHHILSGVQKHLHPHYARWVVWVFEYTGCDATGLSASRDP